MSFSVGTMGAEKNTLDLNKLPDDYISRDGKHIFEEGSSSGYKKNKSGATDGKDESGKVYECRFCSLKFCKSQALGGHMNLHRHERMKEILHRARQLVSNNHTMAAQGHLGYVYPQRLFSGSSSSTVMPLPPPLQSPPQPHSQPSQYYNVVYVVGSSRLSQYPQQNLINYPTAPDSNYTCIGAPVGHVLGHGAIRGADMGGSGMGGDVSSNIINRFQDGF